MEHVHESTIPVIDDHGHHQAAMRSATRLRTRVEHLGDWVGWALGRSYLSLKEDRHRMSLLRPQEDRPHTAFRSYTVIRCPYNGHQASFCRGLCEPVEGHGHCGRIAPHAMVDRYQAAIASYKARPVE